MVRIYIDNKEIDLNGNEQIELNYLQNEISDFTKQVSSYSKVFTVPGTKNNNKVFEHYWELGSDSEFDINKKIRAQLTNDSCVVYDGYIQLSKVTRNLRKKIISYDVTFLSDLNRFIKELGTKTIRDVSTLSALTHSYAFIPIYQSWLRNPGDGYVYPFVDYNRGYTTNNIAGLTPDKMVRTNEYKPAIYKRYLLDGIMKDAGFSYDSSELDDELFTRQIILVNNLSRSEDYKKSLSVKAVWNTDLVWGTPPTPIYNLNYTFKPNDDSSFGYDDQNQYNPVTGEITFQNDINVSFTILLDLYQFNGVSTVEVHKNNFKIWDTGEVRNVLNNGNQPNIATFENYLIETPELAFASGDTMKVVWQSVCLGTSPFQFRLRSGSYIAMNIPDVGNQTDFSQVLPNISQVEFFKDILRQMNLYVTNSKDSENHLIIKSRDRYYKEGQLLDWSKKLDIKKDVIIQPISEYQSRTLQFTNIANPDFYNTSYSRKYNDEIYGERTIEIENEFLPINSRKEIKSIYANAINSFIPGSVQINIPKLYSVDNLNLVVKTENKPIHMFYNGIKKCETYKVKETDDSPFHYTTNDYPFCSSLFGEVNNPTFSLTWDSPKQLYFEFSASTISYPERNLFTEFYANTVDELLYGKMVTCYMHLTPNDIANLDFANQIFIEFAGDGGHYFKLLAIENYNPNETLCKVKLLKSENLVPRPSLKRKVRAQTVIRNNPFEFFPDVNRITAGWSNQSKSTGALTVGIGNTINSNSEGSGVFGINNTIGTFSQSSLVSGSSNKVNGANNSIIGGSGNTINNINNSSIINSNQITIDVVSLSANQLSSNITVINSSGLTITGRTNINVLGLDSNYSLDFDNTTYVRNLLLTDLTGATTEGVVVDANGMLARGSSMVVSDHSVDNGINTFTAGTPSFQSVNVTGLTIDNISVSGNSSFNILSANTYYSGTTLLETSINNYVYNAISGASVFKLVNNPIHNTIVPTNINTYSVGGDNPYSTILNGTQNSLYSNLPNNGYWNTIIAGRNNTITNGNYNSILGGRYSIIYGQDKIHNTIVNGANNQLRGVYGFIGNGRNNYIQVGSNKATILNGYGNKIFNYGLQASILAGYNNQINSAYSTILNGVANIIPTGLTNVVILNLDNFTATESNTVYIDKLNIQNAQTGGDLMLTIDSVTGNVNSQPIPSGSTSSFSSLSATTFYSGATNLSDLFIVSGNTVGTGEPIFTNKYGNHLNFKAIAAGSNITLNSNSTQLTINAVVPVGASLWTNGSGAYSIIANNGNTYGGSAYNFVAGRGNFVYSSNAYASILNGLQNQIKSNSYWSTIVSGNYNYLSYSARGVIISGYQNRMYTNNATHSNDSLIGGGMYNKIINSRCSLIGNGLNNVVRDAAFSSILNGYNNLIDGVTGATIVNGSMITATTSNTVYVDKFNIKNASNGGDLMLTYNSIDGNVHTQPILTGSTNSFSINNGINTFTGGTNSFQSVNITGLTINNLSVSGNSTFNSISANTIYSGATNLGSIFQPRHHYVYKNVDQSYTGSTTIIVDDLTFNIESGKKYWIDIVALISGGTGGMRLGLSGSTLPEIDTVFQGNTNAITALHTNVHQSNGLNNGHTIGTAASLLQCSIKGVIHCTGATGTISVVWRSLTGSLVSVLKHTSGRLEEMNL